MKLGSPRSFDDELHLRWTGLLRWVTVILLAVGFAGTVGQAWLADHDLRRSMLTLHLSAGMAVLLVTLLRIATTPARRFYPLPLASGLRKLALAAHTALYLALIATPLLGWALTSARGQTALFLGAIPLPSLLPSDADLARQLQLLHHLAAGVLVACIALYAVALGGSQPRGGGWRRWWPPARDNAGSLR